MAECCIDGCSNIATRHGKLKFYTLPTAKSSRPYKVRRRQLWLEAIEKVNGSIAGLKDDAQVCSAHFVSGQMSLQDSDQDFVPSVFPQSIGKTRKDTLSSHSEVPAEEPEVTPKKRTRSLELNHVVFPQVNYCEPLEDEDFLEEEVTPLSTNQVTVTDPPTEILQDYPQLKKPKLELKSVVVSSGLLRCDVCNDEFSTGSMLVKHKRLHDQEWPDDETWLSVSEKSDLSVPVEKLTFKCNMCDRSFPTVHNLKRHKLLHVPDARKCKLCGTMFCKRHNHVVAQPLISTKTNFKKDDKMYLCMENKMPEPKDGTDDSLYLVINSDSQTLDAIAAAQNQSIQDTEQMPESTITIIPQKPGLITAFKSFLTKSEVANAKTEQLEASSSVACSSAQYVSLTQANTTADSNSATNSSTCTETANTTLAHLVSTPSRILLPFNPQVKKPLLLLAKPSQPQPVQTIQNIEQSTVCLSFSKPLPSNVVKEFMSYISKNESKKSTRPQLITFTSSAKEAASILDPNANEIKKDSPADEMTSVIKVDPAEVPMPAPQLPNKQTAERKKKTFMIARTKPFRKLFPLPPKTPLPVPAQFPPLLPISPVKPKPKPKDKPAKIKESSLTKPDAPHKPYVHGSRPPSPEPILGKIERGPWDSPFPNYGKAFIQPHLPQTPALPLSLQIFSPQFLTSALLDVERDFDYILSK